MTEIAHALHIAREMASAGIPIFLGYPSADDTGFSRPNKWQQTIPDPSVVDKWEPGMALCAVMGCGLDLIDVDPRSGGDIASLGERMPRRYGVASTPSAGTHYYVRSLHAGSRDGTAQGIDVKGGLPDGSSRGFAFLPPTVRTSKVDHIARPYVWLEPPDMWALAREWETDRSGQPLAALIASLRAQSGVRVPVGLSPGLHAFLLNKAPHSVAQAEQAIRDKLMEVMSQPATPGNGFRRILLRASMTLAGYVGTGYLSEPQARSWLLDAVTHVWGTPDVEDMRWIDQGLKDGTGQPFHVYTPDDEAEYGPQDSDPDVVPVASMPDIMSAPFDPSWCETDQDFAEAVLAYVRPIARYAVDAQTWIVRDGDSWGMRGDIAAWCVSECARFMPPGVKPIPKDVKDRTPEHWKAYWKAHLLSTRGSSAISTKIRALVAAGNHASCVRLAELDSDPLVLWAGGFPYDLRSAEIDSAVDPATPHLQSAGMTPDSSVSTPAWDAFLAAVWPDEEIRRYAIRVLSVSLAGYPDAVLPVLYGATRTGKTSVASLLVRLLTPFRGNAYGGALDPDLISNQRGGGTKAHLFELKGRRLAFLDESIPPGKLALERLKQLTGGGQITADPKYGKPVTFESTHTIVITSNDPPSITDPAVRARIRLLPCDGDAEAVKAARTTLAAVWDQEAPGILARMMAECSAWLADRASVDRLPAEIAAAGDELVGDQDDVSEWLDECCVVDEVGTPTRNLLNVYGSWLRGQESRKNMGLPSPVAFGRELSRLGVVSTRALGPRGDTRGWLLRVKPAAPVGLGTWSGART